MLQSFHAFCRKYFCVEDGGVVGFGNIVEFKAAIFSCRLISMESQIHDRLRFLAFWNLLYI